MYLVNNTFYLTKILHRPKNLPSLIHRQKRPHRPSSRLVGKEQLSSLSRTIQFGAAENHVAGHLW